MTYTAKMERNGVRMINAATDSTVPTLSGDFTAAVVQGAEAHGPRGNGQIRMVNICTGSTIRTI